MLFDPSGRPLGLSGRTCAGPRAGPSHWTGPQGWGGPETPNPARCIPDPLSLLNENPRDTNRETDIMLYCPVLAMMPVLRSDECRSSDLIWFDIMERRQKRNQSPQGNWIQLYDIFHSPLPLSPLRPWKVAFCTFCSLFVVSADDEFQSDW